MIVAPTLLVINVSRLSTDGGARLLAFSRLPEHKPVAMFPSRVMCPFPTRVLDGPLADLHDTIAGREPDSNRGLDEFDVRPLKPVSVDIICNLGEQDPFRSQHSVRLRHKGGIQVSEIITILDRGLEGQTESVVEVFGPIPALVWNVRRIVYDYVE